MHVVSVANGTTMDRLFGKSTRELTGDFTDLDFKGFADARRVARWPLVVTFISVGALILGAGTTFWLNKQVPDSELASKRDVMVEIRVQDEDGHPMNGVAIRFPNGEQGVSDSFGEWRGLVRCATSGAVLATVTKISSGSGKSVTKEFKIPKTLPEPGRIALHGVIEIPSDVKATAANLPSEKNAILPTPKPETTSDPSEEENNASNETAKIYERIGITIGNVAPVFAKEADRARARHLRTAILPLVIHEAEALGLKVDRTSPWQLKLDHMAVETEESDVSGLILVRGSFPRDVRGSTDFSYLVAYQPGILPTARAILAPLRNHVSRKYDAFKDGHEWFVRQPATAREFWKVHPGESLVDPSGVVLFVRAGSKADAMMLDTSTRTPCDGVASNGSGCRVVSRTIASIPPRPGWLKKKFRLSGRLPIGMVIYANGYVAQKIVGSEWSYWTTPKNSASLSFVRDGRIVMRMRVADNTKNPPTITVPMRIAIKK